jgi:hypothetical protein
MTDRDRADDERAVLAAMAAFADLTLAEEEADELLPWVADVRAALRVLRATEVGDVWQAEPAALLHPPWLRRGAAGE